MKSDVSAEIAGQINHQIDSAFEVLQQSDWLAVRSRSATSRVFLVLSPVKDPDGKSGFRLLKHRTPELTSSYAGTVVSTKWLIAFCTVNASEARSAVDITWQQIPSDCEVLKKNTTKLVVRDKYGSVLTLWKNGMPELEPQYYDGTKTRSWERHTFDVTNWHYDSARY